MLVLFATVAYCLNLSIDIGSSFYKSASVVASDAPQPNRPSPAFVAFRARPGFNTSSTAPVSEDDCEFLTSDYGEKAIGASEIRPKMAGGYFSALIGLTDAVVKSKAAALLVPPNPARLHLHDATSISLLGYIESVAKGQTIDHVALIYPAHYTLYDRLVWVQAVEQSGVANVSEFDDVEAVTFNYLAGNRLKPKPHIVLFVDVGATSVKSYAVAFSLENKKTPTAERLSYAVDRNNGGAYLTKALAALVRERAGVEKTNDAEDRRLFAAAERVKLELSERDTSTAIVEIDKVDRTATVSRSEFENGFLGVLVDAVLSVAATAANGLTIDSIELIGGASKHAILEPALKKTLKVSVVRRSLDPQNAIATGGAYALQLQLNQSQLPPVNVTTPFSLHNVSFLQGEDSLELCVAHRPCAVNISRFGFWDRFTMAYSRNNLTADAAVLNHEFRIGRNGYGNVSFHFAAHPFRFIGYEKCNETCIPARFIAETRVRISPAIIRLLTNASAKVERLHALRIDLNATAARILDEIAQNGTVRILTNHTQRLDIIRCVERQKNWAKSPEAAAVTDPHILTGHLTEVKRCIGPVYRRIDENRTFWREAERLYQLIGRTKQLVKKWYERAGPGEGPTLFRFEQKLTKVDSWFNETMRTVTHDTLPWKGLAIRPKLITDKYTEFDADVGIMKAKFGGARMPRLMKGDGSTPTDSEWSKLNDMAFMKNMRQMDMEDEIAAKGEQEDGL